MLLSFHPCLPCCWCQYKTVGPLRSTDIAPLHRYYGPVRHPLAFPPISRFRRLYGFLLRRFRDGTRRASPVARCILVIVLPLPPRQSVPPHRSVGDVPCSLRPINGGSASEVKSFGVTCAFTFVTAQ